MNNENGYLFEEHEINETNYQFSCCRGLTPERREHIRKSLKEFEARQNKILSEESDV